MLVGVVIVVASVIVVDRVVALVATVVEGIVVVLPGLYFAEFCYSETFPNEVIVWGLARHNCRVNRCRT